MGPPVLSGLVSQRATKLQNNCHLQLQQPPRPLPAPRLLVTPVCCFSCARGMWVQTRSFLRSHVLQLKAENSLMICSNTKNLPTSSVAAPLLGFKEKCIVLPAAAPLLLPSHPLVGNALKPCSSGCLVPGWRRCPCGKRS